MLLIFNCKAEAFVIQTSGISEVFFLNEYYTRKKKKRSFTIFVTFNIRNKCGIDNSLQNPPYDQLDQSGSSHTWKAWGL